MAEPNPAASIACAVTPEMRKQVRFWFVIAWARTGYRPWARLLHRFDLHHARRSQIDPTHRRCDWCGLSGRVYEPGVRLIEQGDPDV